MLGWYFCEADKCIVVCKDLPALLVNIKTKKLFYKLTVKLHKQRKCNICVAYAMPAHVMKTINLVYITLSFA